ncbi:MAG TPA: gamma-glutamyl-gamma-aminobutyrate hydrolase family protein [Limnochordales bacterium]|nr:gamma-glutamyl-gamma-aminobutyrate hydrolase family protein [Limnochordales bacterium]
MDDGTVPLVGITTAFFTDTELAVLQPGTAVHVSEAAYSRALERSGAVPVLLPLTASAWLIPHYLEVIDGLILSGGDGYLWRGRRPKARLPDLPDLAPDRWRFEIALLQGALARDLPVLGVCRGHQLIARALSGHRLRQIDPVRAQGHHVAEAPLGRRCVHDIVVVPGTRLHGVLGTGTIGVNSLHRQAVARVAPPLVVSAWAPDGTVEALESQIHRFLVGVQFHPELLLEAVPAWQRLFDAFVAACREVRRRRVGARESLAPPGHGLPAPALSAPAMTAPSLLAPVEAAPPAGGLAPGACGEDEGKGLAAGPAISGGPGAYPRSRRTQ